MNYAYINSRVPKVFNTRKVILCLRKKKNDFVRQKDTVIEYPSFLKMFIFVMSYPIIRQIFGCKYFCINDANNPQKRSLFMIEYHECLL